MTRKRVRIETYANNSGPDRLAEEHQLWVTLKVLHFDTPGASGLVRFEFTQLGTARTEVDGR